MPTWFQCKISYQKEQENGSLKTLNETYLVDALSYTEAEARLTQELSSEIREFDLVSVVRMRLADLFQHDDADTWFKCKVVYTTMDERSGKEKKVSNIMLVTANHPKQAVDRIEEALKTMLVPFDITNVDLTNIVEIFPYEKSEAIPANLRPLSEVIGGHQSL